MNRRQFLTTAVGSAIGAASLPGFPLTARDRLSDWKSRAKTRHRIASIRTWHIDLNPASRTVRRARHKFPFGPFAMQAGALMVEIVTDKGLKGYGLGGGGLAGALIVDRHLRHLIQDRDPLEVEQLWQRMYHFTSIYGRRGIVIYALSGVDLALWDLCGKILNTPVYGLVTEQPRLKIPVYATGSDPGYYASRGIEAVKLPLLHGLDDGQSGFEKNLEAVNKARDALGPKAELMVDAYLKWDVDYTLRFADAVAGARLRWIEEAVALDDYQGMAELVRKVDSTWIVSGEHEFTRHGFRELLRHKAADMVQPDISWAGGFGECLQIASMAAAEGIPTWPHQGGTAWGLHLIATLPMPCRAETFGPSRSEPDNELFSALRPSPKDGFLTLDERPGFGVEIDERLLDAYTVERLG